MALTSVRTEATIDVGEGARSSPANSSPNREAPKPAAPTTIRTSSTVHPRGSAAAPVATMKAPITSASKPGATSKQRLAEPSKTAPGELAQAWTKLGLARTKPSENASETADQAPSVAVRETRIAKVGTSAVAALRAKLQGRKQATLADNRFRAPKPNQSALHPIRKKSTPGIGKPSLLERDKNLKTRAPAPAQVRMRPSEQRPLTGKLPSRRQAMLSQTPAQRPSAGAASKADFDFDGPMSGEREAAQNKGKNTMAATHSVTAKKTSQKVAKVTKPESRSPNHASSSRSIHASVRKRKRHEVEGPVALDCQIEDEAAVSGIWTKVPATVHRRSGAGDAGASFRNHMHSVRPSPEERRAKRQLINDGLTSAQASDRKAPPKKSTSMDSPYRKKSKLRRAHGDLEKGKDTVEKNTLLASEISKLRRSARNAAKTSESTFHEAEHAPSITALTTEDQTPLSRCSRVDASNRHVAAEIVKSDARERQVVHDDVPVLEDRITHEDNTPPMRSGFVVPSTISTRAQLNITAQIRPSMAPETPAVIPSSPPQRAFLGKNEPKVSPIISFDRSVPRNQGSKSARATKFDSALVSRQKTASSLEPDATNAQLHMLGGHVPSSVATMRTAKTSRATPAPASNVASCVKDALQVFLTGPKATGPTPIRNAQMKAAKAASSDPSASGDDTFQDIDDLEGPTLVGQSLSGSNNVTSKAVSERTASQLLMPPPVKATKVTKTQHIPNAPDTISEDRAGEDVHLQPARTSNASQTAAAKRSNELIPEDTSALKRLETGRDAQSTLKEAAVCTTTDGNQTQAAISAAGPVMFEDVSSTKQSALCRFKRAARKPSRRSTQGTVDFGGSPVPKGYEFVNSFNTVLEQFSVDANLSSDHIQHSGQSLYKRVASTTNQPGQSDLSQNVWPPSRQPRGRSSNGRTKATSPNRDSQAITDNAVQLLKPKKAVVWDAGAGPATDPFTSSKETQPKATNHQASPRPARRLDGFCAPSAKQSSTGTQREGRGHDQEVNLLRPNPARRRTNSISSDKSSAAFGTPEPKGSSLDEIGAWRDGLMSHQMNLFDELVTVSHRLVAHLVDRDTAARQVVKDYQRRGLRLVQQMEKDHANEFAAYSLDFDQRKKIFCDDLRRYGGQLRASMEVVQRSKKKRLERAKARDEADGRLLRLLARFQ